MLQSLKARRSQPRARTASQARPTFFALALLLSAIGLANAQGYDSGGYNGNTGAASSGGGSGSVTGGSCGSNQFATRIGTNGAPICAQPSASQVTGLALSATTDTTNASNITSGVLTYTRLHPAVSANLASQYAANGQPEITGGGAMFTGATVVSIVPAPTQVACTCTGGTGTTYYYAVSAEEYPPSGTAGGYQALPAVLGGPGGDSAKSTFASCSGPSALSYPTDYCTVTWQPYSTIAAYKIWGRTNNATTSLTGVAQNTGTGGLVGSSFVDFGILPAISSSQYQSGVFKAEGGLGTGDWSWNNWPGSPGDVFFKEVGSTKENVVMGSANDQIQINSSQVMTLIAGGGVELHNDTVPMVSQIMLRGGLKGDTGALTSISGTPLLSATINADAIYLEHLTAYASALACSTDPTFTIYDCGTSAACSSPTAIASVTPSATGLTSGDSSITTHAVAAAHYMGFE